MKILIAILMCFIFSSPVQSSDYLINAINYQRKINGIKTLRENIQLNRSAKQKACDLNNKGYWSHIAPDGTTPWNIILANGYNYKWAGENLAKSCTDKNCVYLWMNSQGHRDNILFKDYTDVGIGRCGIYKVMHFGSRQ